MGGDLRLAARRAAALGVAVLVGPGCFYIEVINVPPVAVIERVDPAAPVNPRGTLALSARTSRDANGDTLSYAWRARQGGATAAPGDAALFVVQLDGHDPVTVDLVVEDEHGATSSTSLTVPVGNSGPVLREANVLGERGEDRRFIFSLPVEILAVADDPDDDPIVGYSFALEATPEGSRCDDGCLVAEGAANSRRLFPDTHGEWKVRITARDELDSGAPFIVTIVVAPDAAPYIVVRRCSRPGPSTRGSSCSARGAHAPSPSPAWWTTSTRIRAARTFTFAGGCASPACRPSSR